MPERLKRDRAVARFLAGWAVLAGATMTLFDDRFTARSWRFGAYMPGGYQMWGGLLLSCGALMIVALMISNRRARAMYFGGLILVGLWWVLLGLVFLYTACVDPLANPLGVVVWTPLGILYWLWAWYERRRL